MKSSIYFLPVLLLAFSSLFFVSCEKPGEEPARDESLVLTASADTVSCMPRLGGQTALILTWTAGTNHGTGSAISYTLDINYADSGFSSGMHIEIGRTMDRTLTFSHTQLADTLMACFPDMQEEQYYAFELRMRAKVLMTGEEQLSEIVPVTVICHAPVPDLYLIGDATPNGWDLEHATLMINDLYEPSHYTWTGKLHQGEFKILTTTEDWLPCYVRDAADETHMLYRAAEEDCPDLKWNIEASGNYTIDVDTKALTIAIIVNEITERYDHIYMIGDATPGGWSWDNLTAMQHPETDLFVYEGLLNAGQIKFPTEIKSDWSGEMLYAPVPDCAPALNGTFDAHTGDPDNKWVIPSAGTWSITINIKDTTISFMQL